MAAFDLKIKIEIPWYIGSEIQIRPMTIKDERMLLASEDTAFAYEELIKRCCKVISNFNIEKDLSIVEKEYILSKIRSITYGGDMRMSGFTCPHCKAPNNDVKINTDKLENYDQSGYIYLDLSEKSNITSDNLDLKHLPKGQVVTKLRIGQAPLSKVKIIKNKIIEKIKQLEKENSSNESNKNDKKNELTKENKLEIDALYIELMQLAIFIDIPLEKAVKLAEEGNLFALDIKKAMNILTTTKYGINFNTKITCKDCKKEFEVDLHSVVAGDGFLVPCFD